MLQLKNPLKLFLNFVLLIMSFLNLFKSYISYFAAFAKSLTSFATSLYSSSSIFSTPLSGQTRVLGWSLFMQTSFHSLWKASALFLFAESPTDISRLQNSSFVEASLKRWNWNDEQWRLGSAHLHLHVFVHICIYLIMSIFHATVMGMAERKLPTPFLKHNWFWNKH